MSECRVACTTALMATIAVSMLGPLHARAGDGDCEAALAHRDAGRWDEAIGAWRSCLAQDARRVQTPAQIHFEVGSVELRMGNLAYAMEELSAAIRLDPGFGAAYLQRAEAHRRAGMKRESLDDAEMAFKNATDDALRARALTHRGDDFARLNLYRRALMDLDRAVGFDDYAPAYFSRARVHRAMGRAQAAFSDLDSALKADPELQGVYRERAELYALTGQHARAVRDAERVVRLASDDPEAHAFRCRLLNSLALAGIGLESCLSAVRLDPRAERYQLEHAFARWQVGDTEGMRMALGLRASNALIPAGEEIIASFPRLLGERLLASLGYSLSAVDGVVDEDTTAALTLFESEHGAPAGANMDEATLAHLREVLYAQIPFKAGSTDLMPPEPVLRVRSGPAEGRTITLWDIPMTLGREGGQVARIESAAGGYSVRHVSGAPAPTLNGEALGKGAVTINNGDVLGIFGVEIAFTKP